jgi:hypothetical protein
MTIYKVLNNRGAECWCFFISYTFQAFHCTSANTIQKMRKKYMIFWISKKPNNLPNYFLGPGPMTGSASYDPERNVTKIWSHKTGQIELEVDLILLQLFKILFFREITWTPKNWTTISRATSTANKCAPETNSNSTRSPNSAYSTTFSLLQ